MRTNEEHNFELKLHQESLGRQIDRIVERLEESKRRVLDGNDPSWFFPKNDIMDLVQRIGELSLMLRLKGTFRDPISTTSVRPDIDEELIAEVNQKLIAEVNQKGFISGEIQVKNRGEADYLFSALVDAQNIPGVGDFETMKLKDKKSGKVIESWDFDNYM